MTEDYAAPPDRLGERIVSLVPSVTESLFELGLGDRLVGVTDHCIYPANEVARLPHVGGTKSPNIEHILALRPDQVIANREENREQDIEALRVADIAIWLTYPRTVREALDLLWQMVRSGDVPQQSPRMASLETALGWQEQSLPDALPTVFCPIWRNPKTREPVKWWMTFNVDTYMHDLLRVCGVGSVFGHLEARYPKVTTDDIVAAKPDLILLPSEPFAFGEDDVAFLTQVPDLTDRIVLVDGSLLTWHGTRLARALQIVPALIDDALEAEQID